MEFNGAKIGLLFNDRLLMHLRDNKPGLFNANMWDFPGGGRENAESPEDCIIREVDEEFGIKLLRESLVWKKEYPAQKDPNQKAYFFVGTLTKEQAETIQLTEGQRWALFTKEEFFSREDVIDALKGRFKDYVESK
jgi:8-oxo-dGTP diphosphatase